MYVNHFTVGNMFIIIVEILYIGFCVYNLYNLLKDLQRIWIKIS